MRGSSSAIGHSVSLIAGRSSSGQSAYPVRSGWRGRDPHGQQCDPSAQMVDLSACSSSIFGKQWYAGFHPAGRNVPRSTQCSQRDLNMADTVHAGSGTSSESGTEYATVTTTDSSAASAWTTTDTRHRWFYISTGNYWFCDRCLSRTTVWPGMLPGGCRQSRSPLPVDSPTDRD